MNGLLQQLEARSCRSPESVALEGADHSLNVSELLALVQEVILGLRAGGFSTVALLADNSPEWVLVDLACQAEGICLVPVPTFFSSGQIAHVLASAGVELLIFQPGLERRVPADMLASGSDYPIPVTLKALALQPRAAARIPQGTSKITFTSGSTGAPKGVCLSFEQCLNVARSLAQATGLRSPRHLCVMPLAVLLENIGGSYAPLLVDGVVLTPPLQDLGFSGSSGVDPEKFLAALEHHQPNTLILVPQLLSLLDTALSLGWRAPESLQFIAVGGARVAPALVERVRARGLPVYEGYGLSECASVVSLNRPGADRPGTSGRVLDHLRVLPRGGQLRVIGNAFLGYLNEPDSWYPDHVDTGDIGSVDSDGYVTVAGRSKNLLINSYGRNISPEWIESELTGGGLLRQVIVLGDGRPHCAALVYPLDPECPDDAVQAGIDRVNASLPDYARIGSWARLPRPLSTEDGTLTANGRPRRDRIEAACADLIESLYPPAMEVKGI